MKNFVVLLAFSLLATHAEASLRAYMNQYQGSSYTDPYRNMTRPGHNLEKVLLDQITQARETIFIAVQEFRLPLVARALVEKKRLGVDVRVVLEHDYNFTVAAQREVPQNEHETSKLEELRTFVDMNRNGKFEVEEMAARDAVYMLKAGDVPIIDDASDGSKGAALMHHKFMVVDGKSTVVSTANFTMSCVHGDLLAPASRGNANSMVQVNSASFAKVFTEEFKQLWGNGRRGNFGHNKTYRGPQTVTVDGTKITIQFSPTTKRYTWEESVNGLIAQNVGLARQSVKAALFVFSEQRIADVMAKVREAKRVDIGVLVEPNFAFRYYSELLDLLGIEMLSPQCVIEAGNRPWPNPIAEGGVPRLAKGDVLHHKFAVVDGETTIVGSQNWSDAANTINDETLLVIQNEGISDVYGQEYERLRKSASLGVPKYVLNDIKMQDNACPRRSP